MQMEDIAQYAGRRILMLRLKRSLPLAGITGLVLFLSLFITGPRYAMAQGSEESLNTEIGRIDEGASKDATKADEALKEQFGVSKEEIQPLLNEKLSYGNIAALLAVSSLSGKAKQDVLGLIQSGKKWGEITSQMGVDLGAVVAKAQEVGNKVSGEATAKPKRKMKFAPGT
jgi:hypothetical protein